MRSETPAPSRTTRAFRRARSRLLVGLVVAGAGLVGADSASAAGPPVSLRVVGGSPVGSIASEPFQVALYIQSAGGLLGSPASLAFCGGVIVDPTQIITAAHCVTNELTGVPVPPGSVSALAGTATLPPGVPAQPFATNIAVDPQYNPNTADYDVAVVTFATPFYAGSPRADGTAAVAPIPLITPALAAQFANPNLGPAEPATISGWGETNPLAIGAQDNSPDLPTQLQSAQIHLVPDATCASEYSGLGSVGVPSITPRMLCAGEPAGGTDACSGDSGGPLVVDVNNPASPPADYVLAGLIDFGAGCAQAGFPGVYVRLATPAIATFIAQQAQAQGQQLIPAPTPTGVSPPRRAVGGSARATLASRTGRVTRRVALVAVRCATSTCTGSLTLRTTTTVGLAHFSIPADSTARVPVRITPTGQRELDRHRHRLRTHATLRTTGSIGSRHTFTITD